MLIEILTFQTFAVLFVFVRVGAALMLVPGFAAAQVSPRIRLLIALAISLLLTPLLSPGLPALPDSPIALGLLVAGEALIGVFLGTLTRILLAAVHTAGTLISLFASLANAMVQDPVSDQQASTVAGFLSTTAVLMLFVTDQHLHILEAIVASYTLFPAGEMPAAGDLAGTVTRTAAQSFALGLQMSLPFLIIGFTYSIGLGLLGRLMPQLPVFFFGLPAQISLQVWAMLLTLSAIMLVFLRGFADGLAAVTGV